MIFYLENIRSGGVAEQSKKALVFSLVTLKLRACDGKVCYMKYSTANSWVEGVCDSGSLSITFH